VNFDKDRIVSELKPFFAGLTSYSETARLDSFLACYADNPNFVAVSGDGIVRDYEGFKKISKEYYDSLKEQTIVTTHEQFQVLDEITCILAWSGNIDALFKNGDKMIMEHYSVTFVFRKMDGVWKIIHSHESALPPQIIKST
jgi:ketosteroid isomerase-like protein